MSHWNQNAKSAKTLCLPAGQEALAQAVTVLAAGGLVAFPTETVYGLGADATNGLAVARIYEAKGRPSFNPLIAHVIDIAAARREGIFNAHAELLAHAFWPGPLTLVLPLAATCSVCDLARAGLDSVALRVPAHPVARALLAAFGKPLAAPSANRSGRISPTRADDVMAELDGRCELVIDGGPAQVGLESTIIDCTGAEPILLRPGGLARDDIENALGHPLTTATAGGKINAPGLLASHYAPGASLRLDAFSIEPGEAALDFHGQLSAFAPLATAYADLSPRGQLREAAAHLFASLRKLDATGAGRIAVAPIPDDGLGEAINDRLRRAAAPRG